VTGSHTETDQPPQPLVSQLVSYEGAGLRVVELSRGGRAPGTWAPGMVTVGVHRSGPLPLVNLTVFDILLTTQIQAQAPWCGLEPAQLDAALAALRARAEEQPVAAAVAAQSLRASLQLSFEHALVQESLAYSMLLSSAGFRKWRSANPPRHRSVDQEPRVLSERDGATLRIRLNRAAVRNAFDARMRDELTEALEFAASNPDVTQVELTGDGPSFSAGGDLDEFGTSGDAGLAHLIRILRSPARLAHKLGTRLTVRVHGACIGAGIEVPAAARRVVAASDAFFELPEVGMGLVPGAGGTASIPRRIGFHRACFMAITGRRVDAQTALAWGLVDALAESS